MDLNFSMLILIGILVGALIFIGREFEERYPSYVDYLKNTNQASTIQQQLRTGAYLVLDYLSDMSWPGSKQGAYSFKRQKCTKEEINAENRNQQRT